MRRLFVLAALTGCPAPAPPPVEEPPPPPPHQVEVPIDAAPAPQVPGVLAVRSGRDVLEVVHVEPGGEPRVVHELRRKSALPRVADLAVDAASGRYAILVEADTIDGAALNTRRNVMSLVLGSLSDGLLSAGPADKKCVMHKCFESEVALAPGGDVAITTRVRSSSTDLARYVVAAPTPSAVKPKDIQQPALSPDLERVAYIKGGALHVADLGGTPSPALAKKLKHVVATALGDTHVAYRTAAGAVTIVEVASGTTVAAPPLAADLQPPLRVAGGAVFTDDGGSVLAIPVDGGDWRAITTGALIDVSPDGAWVLADSGALAVVAVSDGQVWASHDVPAAFGEVRARLSP